MFIMTLSVICLMKPEKDWVWLAALLGSISLLGGIFGFCKEFASLDVNDLPLGSN